MNRRDSTLLARALATARHGAIFEAQTAATAWFYCIEVVADALAARDPSFSREGFMAECRAPIEDMQALAREAGAAEVKRMPDGRLAFCGRSGPLAEPIEEPFTEAQ